MSLSITAANVGLSDVQDGQWDRVKAGTTITQGQFVYENSSGVYMLANAATSQLTAEAVGIALLPAAADDYFLIARNGTTIDIGATTVTGETYILDNTNGGIDAISTWASGWYKTTVGQALNTSGKFKVQIVISGVAKA